MPGAGKHERWLQNTRVGLVTAALAVALIILGIKYFTGS